MVAQNQQNAAKATVANITKRTTSPLKIKFIVRYDE